MSRSVLPVPLPPIDYPSVENLRRIVSKNWSFPDCNFDEVYPGILLGDGMIARDVRALAELGVTHVLNAAVGVDSVRYVDTSELYYLARKHRCKFMGIPASDIQSFQLAPYFHETSEFIADGLRNPGSKVLVHCLQGLSRSATLVLAFLMIKKGMTVTEAVETVRSKRRIYPNDGFLQQLCDLEMRMQRLNNMSFEPYNLRCELYWSVVFMKKGNMRKL